jgi:hypothetical protein
MEHFRSLGAKGINSVCPSGAPSARGIILRVVDEGKGWMEFSILFLEYVSWCIEPECAPFRGTVGKLPAEC